MRAEVNTLFISFMRKEAEHGIFIPNRIIDSKSHKDL